MDDIIKTRGASNAFKDDRGGAVLIPSAVLGVVKNNIDPTRSGKIQVFLKRLGSNDPDNPAYWTTVSYLSPFFGTTGNTASSDGYGDYVGNPNSYGFWATPPDVNTEVVCVFLNGDPNFGYYIGSIPKPGLTHMVPAIGANSNVVPNEGEADSYGGAPLLPVSEINNANDKQDNNPTLTSQPRPVHSYQAGILFKQGLLRDPDRGPITSSAQRESPSRVFGMSTPGRPIYQGGYDDDSIADAIKDPNIPDKNFKIIGRRGGHTFVMDDGDVVGKDQLMRFRTATGHTILMNDAAQTIFIIHANGQSYIELGKEGTIDMFSTNSVNIRTQGDLNLHADNNINIQAVKDINIAAENIRMETEKEMSQYVGENFKNQTKGNFTVKTDGGASIDAQGAASLASADNAFINGAKVNLNTGSTSIAAAEVQQLTKTAHSDTISDPSKGFVSVDGQLESVVSRAPAHAPWAAANKGVDVKVDSASPSGGGSAMPEAPSPEVASALDAAPSAPPVPTSPALAATVPSVPAASSLLDKNTTSTMVSQMAVNAANGPAAAAVAAGSGIVNKGGTLTASIGSLAMSPSQLVATGHLKPGTDSAIEGMIKSGKSLEQAMSPSFFTGKDGISNLSSFCQRTDVQANASAKLLSDSQSSLTSMGIITGKESSSAAGGLIMSGAVAGTEQTASFVKSVSGEASKSSGGFNPSKIFNSLGGSIPNLIAGGGMAATMAKKVMGPGDPAKLLSDSTASLKSMVPGIPQNLSSLGKGADSTASATSFADKIKAEANSLTGSISSMASNFTNKLSGMASDLTSKVSNAIPSMDSLKSKLNSSLGLTSVAGASKSVTDAIGKVTTGGPAGLKMPNFGEGTFNTASLDSAVKNLLGNPKIPSLPGAKLASEKPAVENPLAARRAAIDDMTAKRQAYEDLASQYGRNDPKTTAAFAEYKAAMTNLDNFG